MIALKKKMSGFDLNALIGEFETKLANSDEILYESTNIQQVVSNSLSVLKILNYNMPLETYIQVHSQCLAYFSSFRKSISNKNKFSIEALNSSFEFAFQHELLIPRLYTALLIACVTENPAHLSKVSNSLVAVFHPLRAMMLRFTAMTHFPVKPDITIEFAKSNFDQMLLILPSFMKAYPKSTKQFGEWLMSNISVAMYLGNSADELITHFFTSTKTITSIEIVVTILSAIETNITPEILVQNYPNFISIINSILQGDRTVALVENIVKHSPTAADSFRFVKQLRNKNDLALLTTQIALDQGDFDTVSNCATLWPTDEVFELIFKKCGHNQFAKVVPNIPNGTPITPMFVKTANDDVLPTALRKVLENEMSKRSNTLNDYITQFVTTVKLNAQFLLTVFAEPYIPMGEKMVKAIVFQCIRENLDYNFILRIVKKSYGISDQEKISLLSQFLPKSEFAEVFPYVTSYEGFKVLLQHLDCFEITKDQINELSQKYMGEADYGCYCLAVCAYVACGFIDEALETIKSYVSADENCISVEDQLDLYINAISLSVTVCDKDEKLLELTNEILNHLQNVIEVLENEHFPISTPEHITLWLKTINVAKSKVTSFDFEKILSLLSTKLE